MINKKATEQNRSTDVSCFFAYMLECGVGVASIERRLRFGMVCILNDQFNVIIWLDFQTPGLVLNLAVCRTCGIGLKSAEIFEVIHIISELQIFD